VALMTSFKEKLFIIINVYGYNLCLFVCHERLCNRFVADKSTRSIKQTLLFISKTNNIKNFGNCKKRDFDQSPLELGIQPPVILSAQWYPGLR